MAKLRKKNALLESIPMLVLLGLLAGAVGGLGIGLIQLRADVVRSQQPLASKFRLPRRNQPRFGAGDGDRTRDIQLGKLAFYR